MSFTQGDSRSSQLISIRKWKKLFRNNFRKALQDRPKKRKIKMEMELFGYGNSGLKILWNVKKKQKKSNKQRMYERILKKE